MPSISLNRRLAVIPIALMAQPCRAQSGGTGAPEDEIVVSAPAGDQQRIDRHVYVVKDNAQAQTETGLQLMRHVPSVTVNSDDKVQLMGDPNVTVLVDGHATTDGSRALKALPAGQIARIEVMTNPSAAYSAEGTAGIINIITRERADLGLAGAATITRSEFGGAIAKLAPSFTAGPWSASVSLTYDNSRFRNDVTQDRVATDPAQSFSMRRHNASVAKDFAAHAEIGYKPVPSRSWTLTLDHEANDTSSTSVQSAVSRGSTLFPLLRNTDSYWGYYNDSGAFAYSWTGERQGENLAVSATLRQARQPLIDQIDEDYGGSTQLSQLEHIETTRSAGLKADYTHPFRKSDILTIGASVVRTRKGQVDGLSASGDHIVSLPFGPDRIAGTWVTLAAYATLQFPIGKWTVLPGVRVENRNVDAPDLGPNGPKNALFVFPSLHIDRAMAERLNLSLSYSRRVEWPSLRQLDPLIHYYDPINGYSGNPALRPQLTDAVEASLTYKVARQSISLKLYDRETAKAWLENATLLPNGVSLTSIANIGSLRKLGGELSLQGAIGSRWHYNANIDLLARRSTLFQNGIAMPDEQFTYNGNAQVEYQDHPDGRPGANRVELAVQYLGPTNSFQTRTSKYTVGSLTWTHSFTARLSSVLKVADLFAGDGGSIDVFGANYRQRTRRLDDGRRVVASLTWRLGKAR